MDKDKATDSLDLESLPSPCVSHAVLVKDRRLLGFYLTVTDHDSQREKKRKGKRKRKLLLQQSFVRRRFQLYLRA
jgi:hypothetical protein